MIDSFVCQSSRSRYNTDLSFTVNIAWHNSNLALSWFDNTWAVWSNQSCLVLRSHDGFNLDHVQSWNTLSNADDQVDFSLNSFEDGVSSEGRWDVDNGSLSLSGLNCFGDISEHWKAKMFCSLLASVHSSYNFSAVSDRLLSVESSLNAKRSMSFKISIKLSYNQERFDRYY